ncbi:MAG: phosphatidate cytidylyltransferase [Candidatus Aminicenantes bacterium]
MSLRTRLLPAFVLLVVVVVCVQFLSPVGFFLILQILILASLLEFYNLSQKRKLFPHTILGCVLALTISCSFLFIEISLGMAVFACLFIGGLYYIVSTNRLEKLASFPGSFAITFFGALYLSFPLNYFYLLKGQKGGYYIYFLLAVVFLGDTGAYIFGKLWGRRKMLPMASPRKTWEGSLGGILFGCLGAAASQQLFLPDILIWRAVLGGFFIHAVAQISDPLESLFKRAVGVKDSSRILLGHGGFLDRVDSLILATPFYYYYIHFFWS